MARPSSLVVVLTVLAALGGHQAAWSAPILSREVLARAEADECFAGIGVDYPPGPPCAEGVPKVNQAYVWGLTRSGDGLWFGTAANVECLVLAGLGLTIPHDAGPWVCEFKQSQLARATPALGNGGDWRPARIHRYDLVSGLLEDLTPMGPSGPLTTGISGLRSAASFGDLVFLAGPSGSGGGSLGIFLFDGNTREFLAFTLLPGYHNIRRWLAVDGVLYAAVGKRGGGGRVLRWTGTREDPFHFQEVGSLDGDAADLTLHQGRIFVSTWPQAGLAVPVMAGLWMSPPLPPGGLTADHLDGWTRVWKSDDYEPDPLQAYLYGGGALASFDGWLHWGTMHVPYAGASLFFRYYGTPTEEVNRLAAVLGTWRAVAIFRGRDFDSTPQIQLLYGEEGLPRFTPPPEGGDVDDGTWETVPNAMGAAGEPRYGASGFGDPFNNYTWSMAVHRDQLFVGTMDHSYLLEHLIPVLGEALGFDTSAITLPEHTPGADLFRFLPGDHPALAESLDGVGNEASYGIRNMLSSPEALYLGMANPMNLLASTGDGSPRGGWELLRLRAERGVHPEAGRPGSVLSIVGSGFGDLPGRVLLGGRPIRVEAWSRRAIEARVPRPFPRGRHLLKVAARPGVVVLKRFFTVTGPGRGAPVPR
jgi:hypothetical protein